MKSETYLNALILATSRREVIREDRGMGSGIAVRKDKYALWWQQLNRQAKKFERKLRERLQQ